MSTLTRRRFAAWAGALLSAVGLAPRRAVAASEGGFDQDPDSRALLDALAVAILPSEIGRDGALAAAGDFSRWIAGSRPGAELLHAYGSSDLESAPPLPASRWREQLRSLDRDAHRAHGTGFTSLRIDQRLALVRRELEREARGAGGIPPAVSAGHVAVALLSRYYQSPAATDLCYRARIRPNQCRPLVNAPRQPLPLAPRTGKGA